MKCGDGCKYTRRAASSPADDNEAAEALSPHAPSQLLDAEQIEILTEKIHLTMNDIEYFGNPDFNIAMLAKCVDSNTRYVSWVLNSVIHKSFKTYLNEIRIKEACMRLSDVNLYNKDNVKTIAVTVGYRSPTSFIIAFKNIIGMTPAIYRNQSFESQL